MKLAPANQAMRGPVRGEREKDWATTHFEKEWHPEARLGPHSTTGFLGHT